jgi:hypothetical protein
MTPADDINDHVAKLPNAVLLGQWYILGSEARGQAEAEIERETRTAG